MKLISFLPKEDLLKQLKFMIELIEKEESETMEELSQNLREYYESINKASLEVIPVVELEEEPVINKNISRLQWQEVIYP